MEENANSPRKEREEFLKNEREACRSQRMRQRTMEAQNEETIMALEQVFEAKLQAMRGNEQRLAKVTDPYARRTLQKLVEEERRQLLYLAELTELLEQGNDMGRLSRARRTVAHRLSANASRNFIYGLGVAALGILLLPAVKQTLRPIALKAMEGVMDLSEQAQGLFSSVREDIEDIVAEAQFEKLKQSIDMSIEDSPADPTNPVQ